MLVVWQAEGPAGFKPFLNLEALLVVGIGTLVCVGVSYPLEEAAGAVVGAAFGRPATDEGSADRRRAILQHGADSAVGMGWVATLLGTILLLSSVEEVSAFPRRMALALTSLLYGLLLSKAFFAPLARRVRGPELTLRFPRATR